MLSVLLASGMLAACAPRLAPLYQDYEIRPGSGAETGAEAHEPVAEERIRRAFEEAGWTIRASETPNLIATEERTTSHWGLYEVRVQLEATRVGDEHVRLFIHPYRRYFTGGRSKIPYLRGRLRGQILPELSEAFEKHGIQVIGTPFERDRAALSQ